MSDAPKFGTSGLRGLVTQLTPALVSAHVRAFVASCDIGPSLYVGHDLRASSPMLAEIAAQAAGVPVKFCGPVPTPALALAAMKAGCGAIMVTGSHIPADRNGLKFYASSGEITKVEEAAIVARLDSAPATVPAKITPTAGINDAYGARYRTAYGDALSGLRLGLYAHSAVGRDMMAALLRQMGAKVTELGRATAFVPVDTEAVPADVRRRLQDWARDGEFDAIISTDADGDRPLLADGRGQIIPGDVLGQITGQALGAQTAVTPVSSNSGAEEVFGQVLRTRIGSPFVIAGMESHPGKTVGYEANGGFLLGFDAQGPAGPLPRLMTRDALLPLIAVLAAGRGLGLRALRKQQPQRFTASDRLQAVPTAKSRALVAMLQSDTVARSAFLDQVGLTDHRADTTDGLRMTTLSGAIAHLRPSGNAPELRFYAEAETQSEADALLAVGLEALRKATA